MAVLGRVLVSSAERLDLPDFLSLDSYTQGDFKYLISSLVGGSKPYIFKGFEVINPGNAIGTQNISVQVADSIVYYPGSTAGPFFHGLPEGDTLSQPLIPELRKNATNYVYLTLTTTEAAKDTRAFWDPDREGGVGGEFTQDVNTQSVLTAAINVSTSSFPEGTMPVCKVVVGANFITSIEDARDLMFRLGTGGISPNPLATYSFKNEPAGYSRKEPNTLMTNSLDPNSFKGGDKNIQSMKEWMDVVMTKLLELSGTTYWYEDTTTLSLVNIFKDALATSIKSKGIWESSGTPGLLTWTEDILIQSVTDVKDVIVRAGNKTLLNDQVMYLARTQDAPVNTGSVAVSWFNGINYVNGPLGSFENLSKGDWIKKADDQDYLQLRVEEFYAGTNLAGGVTAPGNAKSIKLSSTYLGTSESKQASYVKGSYLNSEVLVTDRSNPALTSIGGDIFWLAMRSDTILSMSNAVTTTLSIDITNHDGIKAKVTSTAHGLTDKQRIGISGTLNFDGTYSVEVEDANTFYIYLDTGPFSDELNKSAYYATITTAVKTTANGYQLESANHGLKTDDTVILSSTTNFNGTYKAFSKTSTTFTIPVTSAIVTETSGVVTNVRILVRTSTGPTNLGQGENQHIGEGATENLLAFIGMDNESQTYPIYGNPINYNTLFAQENYNANITDNLTQRVSKLTSMLADKAQDKTITYCIKDVQNISNVANGLNRDITFVPKSGYSSTFDVVQPSTGNTVSIGLTGTLSLPTNSVAYFTLNRNANTVIPNLGSLTVSAISDMPLSENTFIFAVRTSGSNITLWDRTNVRNYLTSIEDLNTEAVTITLPPASSITSGQYFTINSTLDVKQYYVWFNKNGAGGNPMPVDKIPVQINISTGDTNTIIAGLVNSALNATTYFSSSDNLDGTITVSNTSAGRATDAANVNVGGIFSIVVNSQGSGEALNYIADGDVVEVAIKKLDEKIGSIVSSLPDESYDEPYTILAPILSGSTIVLPANTRNGNAAEAYTVGNGKLELFLNGQYLRLGIDWSEVGTFGSQSNQITILQDLVVDDVLIFRINPGISGGSGGGGGSGEANTASNVGSGAGVFKAKAGVDLSFRSIVAGAGVTVTQNSNDITITSTPSTAAANVHAVVGINYVATASNDVILVSNSGSDITVTLPTAVGNTGKMLYIKKIDAGNNLTIDGNGSETIDGMLNILVTTQYYSITVVSDGTSWYLL